MVLGGGFPERAWKPSSSGSGDIARWDCSTEEWSLVPRAPNHRIPMVLHFRRPVFLRDIWQCLETILVTIYGGVGTYWHPVRAGQRCRLFTHKTDQWPSAIQPPNANSAEDGRAYLDVRVQSNGKFSEAPMAVHESPHGSGQIKTEITTIATS